MGIIVVLLLSVAAGYYLFGRSEEQKRQPGNAIPPHPRAGSYHAVSIQSKNSACQAVKVFGSMRFLAESAPHLPVRECKAGRCQCRYVHHDDRRAPVRRRARLNPATELYELGGNPERRTISARRSTDRAAQTGSDLDYNDFEWVN